MDYDAVLAQVLELLQQEQRVAYRVLKRRLQLDDEILEDLKDDLIYAKKLAVDEDGRVLVWTGGASSAPASISSVPSPAKPAVSPAQGKATCNLWNYPHSIQFSGNALRPSPSPCTWAGIPPSWVISNSDPLT